MHGLLLALIFLVVPIVLLLMGLPIYVALLSATMLGCLVLLPPGNLLATLGGVHTSLAGSLELYPLLAIPLFIFAGELMGQGGIARRIVAWVLSVVGGVRGSMGVTTVGSAELFGAMSGSSVGCIAAIGRMLLEPMKNGGYSHQFACSLLASSGAIAVIMPPSISLIIYGVTAQQSIPDLFLAGIVPAIMVGAAIMLFLLVHAYARQLPKAGGRPNFANIMRATKGAVWALLAPVVILGGIYGGVTTPTEAAGIAVIYAMAVSVLVYREIGWRDVWRIALNSSLLVSQIMMIVGAAGAYAWLLTTTGFPAMVVQGIGALHLSAFELLMVINLVLLLIGSVLEPPAAILVLTPLLAPVVAQAGVDLIHFGIIIAVNLAIGLFLPPLGLNILASHAIFKIPIGRLSVGVLPFLAVYLACLVTLTYMPQIVLTPLGWFK
jgi:C4-dicarboxylate transporter DctM subunit